MKRRRRGLRLPGYIAELLRRIRPIHIILMSVALVVVVGGVIVVLSSRQPTAAESTFFGRERITVGVCLRCPGFAEKDASGNIKGFEPDIITEAIALAYPGAQVDIVEVESQEASYSLKTGEIDVAVGMFTGGVLKTQKLSSTTAYFRDKVYAFVREQDAPKGLALLTTAPALVMSTEMNISDAKAGLKELGYDDAQLCACSSYPDALLDLQNGEASALIGPYYLLRDLGLGRIDEPICSVEYKAFLWSDDSSSAAILNIALNKLKNTGRTQELLSKWGLVSASGE